MNLNRIVSSITLTLGITIAAYAAPSGSLNIANCPGGGVTVDATHITWLPLGTAPSTGCVDTGLGTAVTYSGGSLGAGIVGNILDLVAPTSFPVNNFMTFTGTPLDFILAALPAAVSTNGINCASTTAGQSCVAFAGSPFLLTNQGSGQAAISLMAIGTVTDGNGSSNWSGSFTTQLTQSVSSIQSTINGGGSVTSTHSGSFTLATVPEPATMALFGLGLAAVGLLRRRQQRG